jgi:hypothetical protein
MKKIEKEPKVWIKKVIEKKREGLRSPNLRNKKKKYGQLPKKGRKA